MTNGEDWLQKCLNCQYCYQTNDDDYIKCRKRNGKCDFKPFKNKKGDKK